MQSRPSQGDADVDVSVVIPYFNAQETLGLQLEALAHQEDCAPFEVLVVDNRSTSPADDVVAAWAGSLDVRVVEATQAQGVACARNVGLRHARGEFVVMCDADDCAGPRFVASAVAALASAEFVTGNVMPFEQSEFELGREHVWSLLGGSAEHGTPVPVKDPYPILMGGACAMRRASAIALGGFDQTYVPGAEDNDFALRILASGGSLVRVPNMMLAERLRATSSGTFRRSFNGGRMHIKLCAGHHLWKVSPHLHQPPWWLDALKIPAAAAKVYLSHPTPAQRRAFSSRVGLRVGQLLGAVEYEWRRREVVSRIGVGLSSD